MAAVPALAWAFGAFGRVRLFPLRLPWEPDMFGTIWINMEYSEYWKERAEGLFKTSKSNRLKVATTINFHEFLVHVTPSSDKPRSWQSRQWWWKRQRLLREVLLRISRASRAQWSGKGCTCFSCCRWLYGACMHMMHMYVYIYIYIYIQYILLYISNHIYIYK